LHNKKLTHFQGQIETALEKFRSDLGLRLKKLFSVLHVKTHLTGANIRKREGFSPVNLLEQDEHAKTIGEIFRQLEEETGKLTFLERLRHHFSTFLTTILNALADFCDSDTRFRSCLDIITNTFNQFSPLQGCET
jgi:hypothetical protein